MIKKSNKLPKELAEKKLRLVEGDPFFVSPQGEGKYMGRMHAWMRVSTCTLRCAWTNPDGTVTLCDTPYSSHNPTKYEITVDEAFDKLVNMDCTYLAITGGEPTSSTSAMAMIDYLANEGIKVTVETNGTNFFESKADLISMSPKLSTSEAGTKFLSDIDNIKKLLAEGKKLDTDGFITETDPEIVAEKYKRYNNVHSQGRYKIESYRKFMEYYGPDHYQFKFVINTLEDVEEVVEKYIKPLNIPRDNIFFMPQGITTQQLNDKADWVIEQAKRLGVHYTDRLHIRIWGNKVGV